MTAFDLVSYQDFLKKKSLDELDVETAEVIKKTTGTDAGILMQQCMNEYTERQVKDRFLVVYNKAIGGRK
jgi:hypothetical protein